MARVWTGPWTEWDDRDLLMMMRPDICSESKRRPSVPDMDGSRFDGPWCGDASGTVVMRLRRVCER